MRDSRVVSSFGSLLRNHRLAAGLTQEMLAERSGVAKRTLQELTRRLSARHAIDVFSLSGADHGFADLRPWAAAHHVTAFRPLPVGAAVDFHLQQAQVEPQLDQLPTIIGHRRTYINRRGVEVPFGQDPGNVLRHYSLPSRTSGSIVLVFRSTAKTIVRCSIPSALTATAGIT